MDGYIFISSPYTSLRPTKVERRLQQRERYLAAMRFTAHCFKQGINAFSPILHCHEMALKHELPTDAKFWFDFNTSLIVPSAGIFVLCMPGWKESKGVKMEMDFARTLGVPIELVDVDKSGTYVHHKFIAA